LGSVHECGRCSRLFDFNRRAGLRLNRADRRPGLRSLLRSLCGRLRLLKKNTFRPIILLLEINQSQCNEAKPVTHLSEVNMKHKKITSRFLASLLCLSLFLTPIAALAAEGGSADGQAPSQTSEFTEADGALSAPSSGASDADEASCQLLGD